MKILLVGPQGAGKSTQGKLLTQYLNLPYISTGDIFRQLSAEGSVEGERIRQILSAGQLVDDQITSQMVAKRLTQADCQNGFILDGYPRTLEQIKLFDPGFDKVIYLKLSDEEATKRLISRGRADDTPKLIAERLRLYHKQTDSILNYYQNKGILIEIDGKSSFDQIQHRIRDQING